VFPLRIVMRPLRSTCYLLSNSYEASEVILRSLSACLFPNCHEASEVILISLPMFPPPNCYDVHEAI
jgi:hypothetical protein